jgi:hypothetical protein
MQQYVSGHRGRQSSLAQTLKKWAKYAKIGPILQGGPVFLGFSRRFSTLTIAFFGFWP